MATYVAWFVVIFVPIGAIVLFWMLHVLPEKIADKRHHPQKDAIHTLCLLSLLFGGLLWPIAWLWAYTKPIGYRAAYGTDKHDDYYHKQGAKAQAGELLEHELAHLREELDAMAEKGTLTRRTQGAAPRPRCRGPTPRRPPTGDGRRHRRQGRERLMEAILLAIYAFFVWLIFIKFKWLPWNTAWQVTVVIIPIVGVGGNDPHAQRGRPVDRRRPRHQVCGAGDPAGARTRDRGAGRAQSAGQAGRTAVPHRPDPVPERPQRRQGEARGRRGEIRAGGRGRGGCVGRCAAIAGTTEVRQRPGRSRCSPGWSSRGCASGRTGNWWRRAPATSSRWNRPRPT